jgi:transcriptional regulator with XRE-family HTH domain
METLRDTLARRLRHLMDNTVGLDTQVKVSAKSGLSQSTVQRLLARDQAATVDVIEQLAAAFGIKRAEWFLLSDDEVTLLSQWKRLNEADRQKVLGFISVTAPQAGQYHLHQQLNIDSVGSVPAPLQAATRRASARRPESQNVQAANNGVKKPASKRKKA